MMLYDICQLTDILYLYGKRIETRSAKGSESVPAGPTRRSWTSLWPPRDDLSRPDRLTN